MAGTLNVNRVRVLVWVGWPLVVVVVGISLLHFVRYRLGWDVYWEWNPLRSLQMLAIMLAPAAIAEVVVRTRRNNG